MGFCSEETLEDIVLTSEAHKPKHKTLQETGYQSHLNKQP
jgi:hypothetical protein